MKLGKLSVREQVVEAMNRVYRNALTTTSGGNLSAMDENGHIFITPSGIDKGRLSPEDIAEVLPDGTVLGKYAPSMELPFHSAIYAKCPDVKAVVHAHSPAVVAYACMRIAPDPRVADVFYGELGGIISSEYALPGSRELGNIVVGRFEEGYRTVMMDNHGATVGAADMTGALSKFETLDCLCKVLLNAPALGGTVSGTSAPKAQRPAYPVSRQDVADEKNAEEAAYFLHRAYRGGLAYGRTGTLAVRDGAGFIFNCAADRADEICPEDMVRFENGFVSRINECPHIALLAELFKKPYVNAVFIAAPAAITAFSASHASFDAKLIPESYIMLRDVVRLSHESSYDPRAVAAALTTETPVAVIDNGFAVTIGKNATKAFDRMEVLDYSARSVIMAKAVREITPISAAEADVINKTFSGW